MQTVDGVLEYLELVKKKVDSVTEKNDHPLFLAVGFHKPHIPLKFPIEYTSLYPIDSIELPSLKRRSRPANLPEVAWNPWNDLRRRDDVAAARPPFPFGPLAPDEFQRRIRQSYFAAISYVDALFGKLLGVWKEARGMVL